jgi:hypothetical protein
MFYKIFLNYFDLIEMIPCFELFHSTHYLIEVCSTFQTLLKLMSLAYETLVEKNGLATRPYFSESLLALLAFARTTLLFVEDREKWDSTIERVLFYAPYPASVTSRQFIM